MRTGTSWLGCAVFLLVVTSWLAGDALAQADAQAVYQQAKTAYAAGDFAKARQLCEQAAATDPKNPEVFLLLGKAHYQLGELDEAIAAWKQTLSLAPEEPFAAKMLEAIQSRRFDVDARIKLAELLATEGLASQADAECKLLLADKSLSSAQRAKVLTIQAEALVTLDELAEAHKLVQQVLTLHAKEADPLQTALLLGQIKLRSGGDAVPEGLAILRKLAADHPNTPQAVAAQWYVLNRELSDCATATRVEAAAKWVAANGTHRLAQQARRQLIAAAILLSRQSGKPAAGAALSPADQIALSTAVEAIKIGLREEEVRTMVEQLTKHLATQYLDNAVYPAAAKGIEALLAAPLPRPARLLALKALADCKRRAGEKWLADQARVGKLPVTVKDAALPSALAEAVAVLQTIRTEYPTEPMWAEQAALAAQAQQAAAGMPWAEPLATLRGPEGWALEIALPVVRAGLEPAARQALEIAGKILSDWAAAGTSGGRDAAAVYRLVLEQSRRLLGAVPPDSPNWPLDAERHASLLDAAARHQFAENIKKGTPQENAKLSELQKELLGTWAKMIAYDVQYSATAAKALQQHVKPWLEHDQMAVVEAMYTALAGNLPFDRPVSAELTLIELQLAQVAREHQRLVAAGLSVPRQLDSRLQKALVRLYELHAGLEHGSPRLAYIRRIVSAIADHYRALEYDDVAEAALRVKAEKAVPLADQYAAFAMVDFQQLRAGRELSRVLKQYRPAQEVPLTPEFKAVLAGWTKLIAELPESPLAAQAAERVFGIARLFEQQGAFSVAAEIYGEFAKFAAGVPTLAQAPPGSTSAVERATFGRAAALDRHARKLLSRALADRKPGEPPPAKLSDEFAAAIAAYKSFAESHPGSSLAAGAINSILGVALEYARADAWGVAEGIYAELLQSKLPVRRPERLEFARGVCQMGQAIPDHAREVLTALTAAGLHGQGEPSGETLLAGMFLGSETGGWDDRDRMEKDELGDKLSMHGDALTLPGSGAAGARPDGSLSNRVADARADKPQSRPAEQPSPVKPSPRAPAPASKPMSTHESRLGAETAESKRDAELLALIRRQESQRATLVAQLREQVAYNQPVAQQAEGEQAQQALPAMVVSEEELARQEKAIAAAYDIFQAVRQKYPTTATAEQARAEILVMVNHWRGLTQWERAAALAAKFLSDNPADSQLPQLRLEIARDRLAWAARPLERHVPRQVLLAEVARRFAAAREELVKIVSDFPREKSCQQEAQWDNATSFLSEARTIAAVSPTLARGQYVRAARELHGVSLRYPDHPKLGSIPQMLWEIAEEIERRGFFDEAIAVWNQLRNHDPLHPLAQQAALTTAQTYHTRLKRPLKAAEAYLEVNFDRGGSDEAAQAAVLQIGTELKQQKRWVEALYVLELFVNGFPRHPQAGQSLTMIGQIHQANEAWTDAIVAYQRVINEYPTGQWVQEAKWAIAECTINLSRWDEAAAAYRDFVAAYPQDGRVAEANRRVEILKDLARYQALVDEKGQRKAFDAQYQIGAIVRSQLSNPVKAIIEFRKVVSNWPESYVAAPALYEIGTAYLALGETDKAREALREVAAKYPTSPLAGDAMFLVGRSYEDEADRLAVATREKTREEAKEVAQRGAYQALQTERRSIEASQRERIAGLKAAGKGKEAEVQEAAEAFGRAQFFDANVMLFAQKAEQDVEALSAAQMADRQDKINAALRKAVEAYQATAKIVGSNKADVALLQMANIYDQRLKDPKAALQTWLEIVRQFSGTAVAEDASWKIAQYYEREGKYAEAIEAYTSFLRNYRRSPNAGAAQFAIAECYERLGQWVAAMDSYNNYINNFPDGPLVAKAKAQINWIKTYRL